MIILAAAERARDIAAKLKVFRNYDPDPEIPDSISRFDDLSHVLRGIAKLIDARNGMVTRVDADDLELLQHSLAYTLGDIWTIIGRLPNQAIGHDYRYAWKQIHIHCLLGAIRQSLPMRIETYSLFAAAICKYLKSDPPTKIDRFDELRADITCFRRAQLGERRLISAVDAIQALMPLREPPSRASRIAKQHLGQEQRQGPKKPSLGHPRLQSLTSETEMLSEDFNAEDEDWSSVTTASSANSETISFPPRFKGNARLESTLASNISGAKFAKDDRKAGKRWQPQRRPQRRHSDLKNSRKRHEMAFSPLSESLPGSTEDTTIEPVSVLENPTGGMLAILHTVSEPPAEKIRLRSDRQEESELARKSFDSRSVVSNVDDVASQAILEKPALDMWAEDYLANFLAEDREIQALCKEALSRMEKDRLSRNLRRLLKSFYLSLVERAKSDIEKHSVALLRRRESRERVATTMISSLNASTEEERFQLEGEIQAAIVRVNVWLNGVHSGTKPDEPHPIFDQDTYSSGSDSNTGLEPERSEAGPLNITQLGEFIKSGDPVCQFRARLQAFLLPRSLTSIARVLLTVPSDRIVILDSYHQSLSDQVKCHLEKVSGVQWNWWPLSRSHPKLSSGYTRITYRCHCGNWLWYDVSISEADRLRSLVRLKDKSTYGVHLCSRKQEAALSAFGVLDIIRAPQAQVGLKQKQRSLGETQSSRSQTTNSRIMLLFTFVTFIFLPMSFTASCFGMNLKHERLGISPKSSIVAIIFSMGLIIAGVTLAFTSRDKMRDLLGVLLARATPFTVILGIRDGSTQVPSAGDPSTSSHQHPRRPPLVYYPGPRPGQYMQSSAQHSQSPCNSKLPTASQQIPGTTLNITLPPQLFILLGAKRGRRNLEIGHLDTKRARDDGMLFFSLKAEYRQLRGFLRSWSSIWQLSHCEFVKFHKRFHNLGVFSKGYDLPTLAEYTYDPRKPNAEDPPITPHEFREALSTCAESCLFRNCTFAHRCQPPSREQTALKLIPKKNSMWDYKAMKPDNETAWGLEACHEISALLVLIYHIILLSVPYGFWAYWQGVHPKDMQNASVPTTVAVSMITLFWTLSGIIQVLREPLSSKI